MTFCDILCMYAFNAKDGRKSVSVEAMLLDRLQRRLCLLTCDRSSMMGMFWWWWWWWLVEVMMMMMMYHNFTGNASNSVVGARLWRIEQYNYVNGELINCLNVPLGASSSSSSSSSSGRCHHSHHHLHDHPPLPLPDSRGEELELQQLYFPRYIPH